MDTVTWTEFFAKPEVQAALVTVKEAARRRGCPWQVSDNGKRRFWPWFEEAGRGLLEEDLQGLADGFAERLLVGGVEYKKHEPGRFNTTAWRADSCPSVQLPAGGRT